MAQVSGKILHTTLGFKERGSAMHLRLWCRIPRECHFGVTIGQSTFHPRSYWIPGSWNLRMVYTDDILFPDPQTGVQRCRSISRSSSMMCSVIRPFASYAGLMASRVPLVSLKRLLTLQRHFFSPLSLGAYDVRDMPGDCAVGSKPRRRGSPQSYRYAGATRLRRAGGAAIP